MPPPPPQPLTYMHTHTICHVSTFYYTDLLSANLTLGNYLPGENNEIRKVTEVVQGAHLSGK